ncbi:uncharacterized protein E0L32_008725 [Thyridium curvatum]|uniref:Uncharacterized protein n=1 Tax=Thyridium curvatum TaxID=1093900 RepID=A0A507B193_9PEZI|nr:uncharacterized protein E0L32_008725 [Thyridium curvatum]TPX10320.1 hypothetical protein E0L32_008725 [Thyridium curvatum]
MPSDKEILSKLSSRDIEVLVCALYCQKHEPQRGSAADLQIDYHALAARAGFKNGASASACYRPIKNKLDAFIAAKDAENDALGLTCAPVTPSRKRKAGSTNASPAPGTPPAKKRGRPLKAVNAAVEKVEKVEKVENIESIEKVEKKEEPEMKQEEISYNIISGRPCGTNYYAELMAAEPYPGEI